MNELTFRNSDEKLTSDNPNYDNFADQFVKSLEGADEAEKIYWHGRLIGHGYDTDEEKWKECEINFLGSPYTENQWREKLENGEIIITDFTLTNTPSYVANSNSSSNHLDPQVVQCEATMTYSDGILTRTVNVAVTHYIRRTYLSYKTEMTEISE